MAGPPGDGGRAARARRRAHGLGLADGQPEQRATTRRWTGAASWCATWRACRFTFAFWDKGTDGQAFMRYYDATNPEARRYVWEKITDGYRRYGIRAFWLDACEPEILADNAESARYFLGQGSEVQGVYPREHARGFYEGLTGERRGRRAAALPFRLGGQPALRGGRVVGRHRVHLRGSGRADPGRPEHRHLGDPVVDDRHRRVQARRPDHGVLPGARRALVPVRRFLPALQAPRRPRAGPARRLGPDGGSQRGVVVRRRGVRPDPRAAVPARAAASVRHGADGARPAPPGFRRCVRSSSSSRRRRRRGR